MALSSQTIRLIAVGAFAGTVSGAMCSVWTQTAAKPRRPVLSNRPAPTAPNCPENYVRSEISPTQTEQDRRGRWLARCEPQHAQFAFSESLELYWTEELFVDARARVGNLHTFLNAIQQDGALALQPIPTPTVTTLPNNTVQGTTSEVEGSYRLSGFTVRLWALPAGRNTVTVRLVTPRESATTLRPVVEQSIARITGLAPYDSSQESRRGWNVTVRCPEGFSEVNPHNGGTAESIYVGKVCLRPDQQGGTELTFSELAARPDSTESTRGIFQVSEAELHAIGVPDSATFSLSEPVRIANVDGFTAALEFVPAEVRVKLRAYLFPTQFGSVYALATSHADHAATARTDMEQWLTRSRLVALHDESVMAGPKAEFRWRALVVPSLLSAVIGVIIALRIGRPSQPSTN